MPAISAASIQLNRFAIAFSITSCSFIIRSISRAGTPGSGSLTLASFLPPGLARTTHVLIRPDNSHANDNLTPEVLPNEVGCDNLLPHKGVFVSYGSDAIGVRQLS